MGNGQESRFNTTLSNTAELFKELTPEVLLNIEEQARQCLSKYEGKHLTKTAMNSYVDSTMAALKAGMDKLLDNLAGYNLQNRQWAEVEALCEQFVNEQCQLIIGRCKKTWEEDASQVDIRIYQLRNQVITGLTEQIGTLMKARRKQRFDQAIKPVKVKVSGDVKKLLLVGAVCFLAGIIVGKLL